LGRFNSYDFGAGLSCNSKIWVKLLSDGFASCCEKSDYIRASGKREYMIAKDKSIHVSRQHKKGTLIRVNKTSLHEKNMSRQHSRVCLISCSVLEEELKQLVKQEDLDVDLVFVSKYFHVDYAQVEQNLRRVLEKTQQRYGGNILLVYGDLCLGQNGEMKKFTEKHGVVKVDAVNCIDCMLGGKGKFLEADPDRSLLFLGPGMTELFKHFKERMLRENVSEDDIKNLFSGLRGIVFLDTLGDKDRVKCEVERLDTGLPLLEIREIGLERLKKLLCETIERSKHAKG
jgi:hypothetical protein